MILDISSALMSIFYSGAPALRSRAVVSRGSHRPSPLNALHETLFELLQLPGDARVVHDAADLRDQSAENGRIDARLERHRSAGDVRETFLDLLHPLGRERRRRRHFGAHDLAMV